MGNLINGLSSISSVATISKQEAQPQKPELDITSVRNGTIEEALNSDTLKEMAEYADNLTIQFITEAGLTKKQIEEMQKEMNKSFDGNDARSVGGIAYWVMHPESTETRQAWIEILKNIAEHNNVKIKFLLE